MDRLPQEIHDRIVFFLANDSWKPGPLPVVTASRKFQVAAECLTFHHLEITSHDLVAFAQIMGSTPERRLYLKWLSVTLYQPLQAADEIQEPPELAFETYFACDQANEDMCVSLRQLFAILAAWCEDQSDGDQPSFGLKITNSDHRQKMSSISNIRRFQHYAKFGGKGEGGPNDFGRLIHPWNFSLLDLGRVTKHLPMLPCISGCALGGYEDLRMLHPSSAVELLAKLPNANTLDWDMKSAGDWGRYFVLDDMYRRALIAAAQTGPAPLPAKNICLRLKSPSAREIDRLQSLIFPLSYDPLACAVRRLTSNCKSLWYRGPVHPSLFDPPVEAPDHDDVYWQNVTELKVIVSKDSPDGAWYFKHMDEETYIAKDHPSDKPDAAISQQLPPGYSGNERETKAAYEFFRKHHRPLRPSVKEVIEEMGGDESRFNRDLPDTARLSALFRAFAKGLSRMPAVQDARLRIRSFRYLLEVVMLAPNVSGGPYWDNYAGAGTLARCRVFIQFGAVTRYKSLPDWQPEADVLGLFKNFEKDQAGSEALLFFLPTDKYFGGWPTTS